MQFLFRVLRYTVQYKTVKHIDQISYLCVCCEAEIGPENCLSLVYFSKPSMNMVSDGQRCYSAVTPARVGRDVWRRYGMMKQTHGRCHLFTGGSV